MEFLYALALLAVFCLFLRKMSRLPEQSEFYRGERLCPHAVLYNIRRLGKACAVTERGAGIDIKRVLFELENMLSHYDGGNDGDSRVLWKAIVSDGRDCMRAAVSECKRALVNTDALGHVNGVPRLFSLCDLLVGATRGSIDHELIERAKKEFCPLDDREEALFPAMTLYCLCALFLRCAADGELAEQTFSRGEKDGQACAAALDMLHSVDYVCGLYVGSRGDGGIAKLFVDNGILADEMMCTRRENAAERACVLYSVLTAAAEISGSSRCFLPPDPDCEYFVDGTQTRSNILKSGAVSVYTDSRGKIFANGAEIRIDVDIDGEVSELSDFDGVFQSHRTVYRMFIEKAEVCAQIIAPPADGCCLIRVDIINRTSRPICARAVCRCKSAASPEFERQNVQVGEFGALYKSEIGLSSDVGCAYECNYDETASEVCLCAEFEQEIPQFCKTSAMFAVVTGARINAAALYRFADRLYFARSEISARAYFLPMRVEQCARLSEKAFKPYRAPPDIYEAAEMRAEEYIFGEFTQNGYVTEQRVEGKDPPTCTVFDGEIHMKVRADGGCKIFADDKEYDGGDIVLDEFGTIWSPWGERAGPGATCAFRRGYVEYNSVRNGCITTVIRAVDGDTLSEVFLLRIANATDDERELSAMITFPTDDVRTVKRDEGVYAPGKTAFAMFASEHIVDHCEYKEGYLDHGKISRAVGFLRGGQTPAPTLSVNVALPPRGEKKIAFRRTFSSAYDVDGITVRRAESIVSALRDKYENYGKIVLNCSDPVLNVAHAAALYSARGALCEYMRVGRYDRALLTCFAVKYADIDAVTDVVLRLCELQDNCGRIDVGRKTPIATLLLPIVAIDAVNFVGKTDLLFKKVAFENAGENMKPATVLDHCFRAVHYGILLYGGSQSAIDGAVCALLSHAVKSMSEYTADPERRKAYASMLARLAPRVAVRRKRIAAADMRFDVLGCATAYARYDGNCDEYAYTAVKELAEEALSGDRGKPELFSDGATCALFYSVVTEKFLGVSIRGECVKISPRTALGTPHIEFDIRSGENCSHVSVDESVADGGWQVNIDRISIATDTVCPSGADIVMRRSGEAS